MIHIPLRDRPNRQTYVPLAKEHRHPDVVGSTQLTFWPLICSEALQTPTMGSHLQFDVAIIPAYHTKPDSFEQIVTQISGNQHLVILANDGRYGGSRFELPPGRRGDSWWLGHPNLGKLPQGDSLIIADVRPNAVVEVVGALNPSERCQLIKLSAIVPFNHTNSGYVVSESIRELRANETARNMPTYAVGPRTTRLPRKRQRRIKSRAVIDELLRRRVLSDCLEIHGGTPLQALKLQRLLTLSDIDELVWLLHADDVVVGKHRMLTQVASADPPSNLEPHHVEERQPTTDLAQLEASLVRQCLGRLEELENSGPLSDDKQSAIADIRRQLIHWQRKQRYKRENFAGHSKIVSAAWDFLITLAKTSKQDVLRALTDEVAALVAKYDASTAWLFAYTPQVRLIRDLKPKDLEYPLHPIVSHNAPTVKPMSAKKNSLVGACAHKGRMILHANVMLRNDRMSVEDFHNAKPNSRSGVAVPIFSTAHGKSNQLVGVLVLESIVPNAFTALDSEELKSDAMLLAMPLWHMTYELAEPSATMPWYPAQQDWSITPVLNAFCYSISTPLDYGHSGKPFAMTVWRNDPFFAVAYAIGAARFDSDYISHRTLRTFAYVDSGAGHTITPRSFVGSVLMKKPGHLERGTWRRLPHFSRQEKAVRTELDHVFCISYGFKRGQSDPMSATLHSPQFASALESANVVVPPATALTNPKDRDLIFGNAGAVSWYTYLETTAELTPLLDKPSLKRVAEMTGGLVDQSRKRISELALSLLNARLANEGLTFQTTFNVIRDTLIEVFDADGCSIFSFDERRDEADTVGGQSRSKNLQIDVLACVSTSGIEKDGEEFVSRSAYYTLGGKEEGSFSVRVARRAPASLRVNTRVRSHTQQTLPILNESFTLSQQEHRRTLFQSVPASRWAIDRELAQDTSVGLVRIVRSPRKPPFTPDDAEVLSELCAAATKAWDFSHAATIGKLSHPLSDLADQVFATQSQHHNESLRYAIERIVYDVRGYANWNRRQVASCVQDLHVICRRYDALLTMLRVVRLNERGAQVLAIHTHHDVFSSEVEEEGSAEPIERREGGFGWAAIETREVWHFDKNEVAKFTVVFPRVQAIVESGLCIAFVLPTWRELVTCVLSVEFGHEFRKGGSIQIEIEIMVAAALRLTRLSLDAANEDSTVAPIPAAQPLSSEELAREFLERKNSWAALTDCYDGDKNFPIDRLKSQISCRLRTHTTPGDHGVPWCGDNMISELNPQFEFDRLNAIGAHEFDPVRQASRYVNRRDAQGNVSDSRWFGRSNPEIQAILSSLSLARIKIDFNAGTFYIPLEAGGAFAGDLVGRIVMTECPSTSILECRLFASVILDLSKTWLRRFILDRQTTNQWELQLSDEPEESPLVDRYRASWSIRQNQPS